MTTAAEQLAFTGEASFASPTAAQEALRSLGPHAPRVVLALIGDDACHLHVIDSGHEKSTVKFSQTTINQTGICAVQTWRAEDWFSGASEYAQHGDQAGWLRSLRVGSEPHGRRGESRPVLSGLKTRIPASRLAAELDSMKPKFRQMAEELLDKAEVDPEVAPSVPLVTVRVLEVTAYPTPGGAWVTVNSEDLLVCVGKHRFFVPVSQTTLSYAYNYRTRKPLTASEPGDDSEFVRLGGGRLLRDRNHPPVETQPMPLAASASE